MLYDALNANVMHVNHSTANVEQRRLERIMKKKIEEEDRERERDLEKKEIFAYIFLNESDQYNHTYI